MQIERQTERSTGTASEERPQQAQGSVNEIERELEPRREHEEGPLRKHPILIAGGIITAITLLRGSVGRLIVGVISGSVLLSKIGEWIIGPWIRERREDAELKRAEHMDPSTAVFKPTERMDPSTAGSAATGHDASAAAGASQSTQPPAIRQETTRIVIEEVKSSAPTPARASEPGPRFETSESWPSDLLGAAPAVPSAVPAPTPSPSAGSNDGNDDPPSGERPRGGGGGGEPPKRRRINAWVSETQGSPQPRLMLRKTYTLNFNVGELRADSLVPGEVREVSPDEIPDQGLDTRWIVTSEFVILSRARNEDDIELEHPEGPDSSVATFSLLIPRSGESATRRLGITPMSDIPDQAHLSVIIFARGTLFRQFRVELNVGDTAMTDSRALSESATVTTDVEHTKPAYTGLLPQHEWQTPDGKLTICVTGNGKATYSGEIWSPQTGKGYANNFVDWNISGAVAAGPIRNVQDAADKLRRTFSNELNAIDENEINARLAGLKADHSLFYAATRADASHEQAWNRIAASDEMFQLAYYGYTLYRTFFPDGSKLRPLLDNLPPDWRVDITWAKQIDPNWIAHVPWTLMYIRPPQPGEPVDAMNFLGLRWRIGYVAHFSEETPSPALGGLTGTASAYGLYWGDDDAELVQEVQWQQTQWKLWGNAVFAPDGDTNIPRKQQVLALFNKRPVKPTPLLYCYCHCELGEGNRPVLRFGKTPSVHDNIRLFDLVNAPLAYAPIVFINACGSAGSDPYIANALAENFFDRGCRSYLGPIVKIPVRFASRFAKVFYSFFLGDIALEPIAAGEAVFQARRFLWREYRNVGGLFYAYTNMYEVYMATEAQVNELHKHRGVVS